MKTEPVSIELERSNGEIVTLEGEVTDIQVVTIATLWLNRIDETVNQEKGIQIMEELRQIRENAKEKGIKEEQAFANQSLAFMHKLNCDPDCRKKTYDALEIIFGEKIREIKFGIEEIGKIVSVITAPMFKFFDKRGNTEITRASAIEEELAIAQAEVNRLKRASSANSIDVVVKA